MRIQGGNKYDIARKIGSIRGCFRVGLGNFKRRGFAGRYRRVGFYEQIIFSDLCKKRNEEKTDGG